MRDIAVRLRLLTAATHQRGDPPDSPAEMAARTGLSPHRVAAWFDEPAAPMSVADATAVAAAYGVPVAYLLDDPVPAGIVEELTLLIELRDAGVRVAQSPDR